MNYYSVKQLDATGLVTTVLTSKGLGCWLSNVPRGHENYRTVAAHFGLDPEKDMVGTFQRHSAHVEAVDRSQAGKYILWRPEEVTARDGIITNEPGLMLMSMESDCTPVFLLDPVKKAIGMVHSGWKGTAGQIAPNAVRRMGECYGSDPADIMAAFGPCICARCYEVGSELIDSFAPSYSATELRRIFIPRLNGKYDLDLKLAISLSLQRLGVKEENIFDYGSCTLHDVVFYSHRGAVREGLPTNNNMLTAIMLK